jgi:hypothetical protein
VRKNGRGATGDGTPSKREISLERPTSTISPPKGQARADDADSVTPLALTITYATTQDNFDGQPWPPDGADYWAIVARGGGFTRWRRIFLEKTPERSGAATLGAGLQRNQRL